MAESTGTTAATVSRAYLALAQEGLVQALTGVGTVIKDVQELEASARSGITADGLERLNALITDLRSLGLSSTEIAGALRTSADRLEQPLEKYTALFVAAEYSSMDRFIEQLSSTLNPLGVDIETATAQGLEKDVDRARQRLQEADFVITLLPYKRRLNQLVNTIGVRIYVLLAELEFKTAEALLSIGAEDTVVLLTSPQYRQTCKALLDPYCTNEQLVIPYVPSGGLEQISDLPNCQACVFIYSRELADVPSFVAEGATTILLDFQLRPESLSRLRKSVAADAASRPSI